MPRLFVKAGAAAASLELRLGVNRIGRNPGNHLQIHEPSVSGSHCELLLGAEAIIVTDLGSSNGTFIDGVLVREGFLFPDQVLRLGRVELFVENRLQLTTSGLTSWHRMNATREVLGSRCFHHPDADAEYFCPKCNHQLCRNCCYSLSQVHELRVHVCKACGAQCQSAAAPRSSLAEQVSGSAESAGRQSEFREAVRARLIPYLAAWLKEKFVQVLLQQRSGMIASQEAAARQMMGFERRLATVQAQMEQRIRTYEARIRLLETELACAQEEKQALIRSRIDAMRLELERESQLLTAD